MNDIKIIKDLFGSKTNKFVSKAISLFEKTLSRKDVEKEFSAICGMCARRHIYVDWRANCPDKFYFYKNGKTYWTDVDSLRYDGENAYCVYACRS